MVSVHVKPNVSFFVCVFSFFEDGPLVEFIYLVFTRTAGGVAAGDSGLCCCVPCLSSAIISPYLLTFHISPPCESVVSKRQGGEGGGVKGERVKKFDFFFLSFSHSLSP